MSGGGGVGWPSDRPVRLGAWTRILDIGGSTQTAMRGTATVELIGQGPASPQLEALAAMVG